MKLGFCDLLAMVMSKCLSLINRLVPHIKGNVGFVFTKEDLVEVRDLLLENKVKRNLTWDCLAYR